MIGSYIKHAQISRTYSHWRFIKPHVIKKFEANNDENAILNMTLLESFDLSITKELDDYEACARQHTELNATQLYVRCFTDESRYYILGRSLYDTQVQIWLDTGFNMSDFCFISQELLLYNHTAALSIVSEFVGLAPFNWDALNVTAHSSSPVGPNAKEELPIDPVVLTRLRAFYARHGTYYWDHVRKHGFAGCRNA